MKIIIPDNLSKILDKLNGEPFILELFQISNIYIVGGSIRDSFLDKMPNDIDIVVEHINMANLKLILDKYGKFNVVGESFSVIKFRPSNWVDDIDIALPRYDKQIGPGHKNVEVLSNENITILQDLSRRDITINSIAVNIKSKEILDPFNGIKDLRNKQIRCTNIHSFADDPLRIMRTLAFASRFNFEIVSSTKILMSVHSNELKTISSERILEEFMKILNKGGNIKTMIDVMYETDIDLALFDKKMSRDLEYDKLDILSFFYILAKLGGVDIVKFYKTQLKGEYTISEGLHQLFLLMNIDFTNIDEESLRYTFFIRIKRSPLLLNVKIFPERINDIIKLMQDKIIPFNSSDIKANGDDAIILDASLNNNPITGLILKKFYQSALMNKFKWKDRNKCLNKLQDIIKEIKK